MNRRDFIGKSTAVSIALCTTSTWMLVPSIGCAEKLERNVHETLLKFLQHLFPSKKVSSEPYVLVSNNLENSMSKEDLLKLFNEGFTAIDGYKNRPWLKLSSEDQVLAMKKIEGTKFFSWIYNAAIDGLYRNVDVWNAIGYEGPSFKYGGYIDRGFDDIDWLPEEDMVS